MATQPSTVAIIGLGLIGGSIVRTLRAHGDVKIAAYDSNPQTLAAAKGYVDIMLDSAQVPAKMVELIVLCVPPEQMQATMALQQDAMQSGAVLSDVCSSKQNLVDSAMQVLPKELLPQLVPGHPMAGTEQSGFAASTDSLFNSCRVILTPLAQSSTAAVDMVKKFWHLCGAANIDCMPVERHDLILSAASHLPHMLAYSLMAYISEHADSKDIILNSAGGLRDFTRIADSNPELWLSIAMSNKEFVAKDLQACAKMITRLAAAIQMGDEDSVLDLLREAQSLRKLIATVNAKAPDKGDG